MPPHPTLYLRRSVYERLGGFDTRYRIAADYDLMLRVLSRLAGPVGDEPAAAGLPRVAGRASGADGQVSHQAMAGAALPGRVVYLPQVLVRMRLGGESNRSLGRIARKSWEDYQILRRQGRGGPLGLGAWGAAGALAWKNLSKVPQFFQRG
jgi:glycosyltransferase